MKALSKWLLLAGGHSRDRDRGTWMSQTSHPGPSQWEEVGKGLGRESWGEEEQVDGDMDFRVQLPGHRPWFHLCQPRQRIRPCREHQSHHL